MLSLFDRASMEAALSLPLEPTLHRLLTTRISHTESMGLTEMTHLLVVHIGDSEAAIVEAIGFSPLVNPIDGSRYGSATFLPFWDWLQDHRGWFELVVAVGNSGFAYVLLIEVGEGALSAMCREFAV